ncbi:hypothetical protein [Actinomadura litoris]|uniref:hypothetical protein n=1 Tax=Actinomadura litoris TaxID=2678616 RepID=UPI001FA6D6E5|nr:hypothetical protein [Actinomadura litoris]
MAERSVLVLIRLGDPTFGVVITELARRGVPVMRLDPGEFMTDGVELAARYGPEGLSGIVRTASREARLEHVRLCTCGAPDGLEEQGARFAPGPSPPQLGRSDGCNRRPGLPEGQSPWNVMRHDRPKNRLVAVEPRKRCHRPTALPHYPPEIIVKVGDEPMGADAWIYYVPFQADIAAALADLRRQEFCDTVTNPGWPTDWPRPNTMDQLRALLDETHSTIGGILELDGRLIGPGGQDDFLAIRLLSPTEARVFFGTDSPTRDDFERVYATAHQDLHRNGPHDTIGPCPPQCPHGLEPDHRDRGRGTVLYDQTGNAAHIVFWGSSGD